VVLLRLCVEELPTEAVLKPPHSKRWRDSPGPSNRAKRLECGAFTAAFPERGCGEDQPQRVRAEELAEILQPLPFSTRCGWSCGRSCGPHSNHSAGGAASS